MAVVVGLAPGARAAVISVTTTADGGAGSLREAISTAAGAGEDTEIMFDGLSAGDHSISLASALPDVTNPNGFSVTIDGSTHPDGYVVIDGGSSVTNGLKVGDQYNTIRFLQIQNCYKDGIFIYGNGNVFEDCAVTACSTAVY